MIKTKGFSIFLPYFFLVFIILAKLLLQDFLFFNDYTPFYELIFIYSWSFIADFRWNIILLALLGILRDLLFLNVFGISAIIFVVFALLISSQKEKIENRGFLFTWIYFVVSLVIVLIIRLIIIFLILDITFETNLILSLRELYFTAIVYPLFYYILSFFYKKKIDKV